MRVSAFQIVGIAAIVASFASLTVAEGLSSAPKLYHDANTVRYLKSEGKLTVHGKDSTPNEERAELRGAFSRLQSLFRRDPKKAIDTKLDEQGAAQALSKLKSTVGFTGKSPTKVAPEKLKTLETYARDNPDKWYAMSYYLEYVYGIAFVVIFGAGAIFLSWRPAGMGSPRPN